jgi:hypothetical protein
VITEIIPHIPSSVLLEKVDVSLVAPAIQPPMSPLSPTSTTILSPAVEQAEIEPSLAPLDPPSPGTIGRADILYGVVLSESLVLPVSKRPHDSVPFCTLFEDATAICRNPFIRLGAGLMTALLVRLKDKADLSIALEWEPQVWLKNTMHELQRVSIPHSIPPSLGF